MFILGWCRLAGSGHVFSGVQYFPGIVYIGRSCHFVLSMIILGRDIFWDAVDQLIVNLLRIVLKVKWNWKDEMLEWRNVIVVGARTFDAIRRTEGRESKWLPRQRTLIMLDPGMGWWWHSRISCCAIHSTMCRAKHQKDSMLSYPALSQSHPSPFHFTLTHSIHSPKNTFDVSSSRIILGTSPPHCLQYTSHPQ